MKPDFSITLATWKPLEMAEIRSWYKIVRAKAPSGTVVSLWVGNQETAVLRQKRASDKAHLYLVPLIRNLVPGEIQPIVAAWQAAHDDAAWDIEADMTAQGPLSRDETVHGAQSLTDADKDTLALEIAKLQHANWMHDRLKSGWRYGAKLSLSAKTHPMLRQWGDLPEQYRKIDRAMPDVVLQLLADQGHAVVNINDLKSVIKLAKQVDLL